MILSFKKIILHNAPLRIISLLLGSSLWYSLGSVSTTSPWISVPVCFYNVPEHAVCSAPETITIQIRGQRRDIRMLDHAHLAIHVDASTLAHGHNRLTVSNETLLLPDSIKLVHYAPTNPYIDYHIDHHTSAELP